MKKLLALILALTMVFGTMSFAAAAPSDVVGTEYEDAVSKLTYLDILAGYPDGTFRPEQPVTRAEFAKIIVTALGVGEAANYASGGTKFADVAADHWATGYINVAVDLGVINGYPDGTFAPANQVTFAEAIKMIVAALGYTPKAESMGGYPGGYLAIAADEEITDGVTVVTNMAANRGNVSMMIDNALEVDMMVQTTWGQYPEYAPKEGETLLKKLGVDEVEGRVVAVPRVDSRLKDNEIRIDGKDGDTFEVISGLDFELAFGNEVTAYVKKDIVLGLTVESDFFIDALGDVDDEELTLVQDDEDYDVSEDVVLWLNGESVKSLGYADYAKVILDDDDEVIFIDAYVWDDFIVVEEVDDEVVLGYGEELDLEDFTIVKDGKAIDFDELEEGDILYFHEKAEFGEVYNESFEGEIQRVYINSFRIAGENFDYGYDELRGNVQYLDDDELDVLNDSIAEDMLDEGEDVVVYVNRLGNAVFVMGDTGEGVTSSYYAMVIAEMGGFSIRNKHYVNLDVVNAEGKEINYDVELQDAIDWGLWVGAVGEAGAQVGYTDVVEIEIEQDGDLEKVTLPDFADKYIGTPAFKVGDTYVDGLRLQNSAVVFNVEKVPAADVTADDVDVDDITVATLGEVEYDEIDDGDVYHDDKDRVIAIVVHGSDLDDDNTDYTAVALKDAKEVKGEDVYELELNVDGKEDTYFTEEGKAMTEAAAVKEGDFLVITVRDKTGEIIEIADVVSDRIREDEVIAGRSTQDATINIGTVQNPDTVRLADATFLDANDDYEMISIRDLAVGDEVTIIYVSGSTYANFIIKTDEGQAPGTGGGTIGGAEFDYDEVAEKMTVSGLVYDDGGDNTYLVKISGDALSVAVYSGTDDLIEATDNVVLDLTGQIPVNGVYLVEFINTVDYSKVVASKSMYLPKNVQ